MLATYRAIQCRVSIQSKSPHGLEEQRALLVFILISDT